MRSWYIKSNGFTHEFHSWKDAMVAWTKVKVTQPGDAVLCRGNGTLIDCA